MAKNVILQLMIENQLEDIFVRGHINNIIVDESTGETLATRLANIMASIDGITSSDAIDQKISAAIDGLIDGAPDTYNTLKEVANYIATHEDVVTALNQAIGSKVDKVDGKGLSTEDFTTTLKTKLESLAKVEASATNGNIKIDGVETPVYQHPDTEGNKHIPAGGTAGQVLRANGQGSASWGENVRYGVSAPADLAAGEFFVKIVG